MCTHACVIPILLRVRTPCVAVRAAATSRFGGSADYMLMGFNSSYSRCRTWLACRKEITHHSTNNGLRQRYQVVGDCRRRSRKATIPLTYGLLLQSTPAALPVQQYCCCITCTTVLVVRMYHRRTAPRGYIDYMSCCLPHPGTSTIDTSQQNIDHSCTTISLLTNSPHSRIYYFCWRLAVLQYNTE